MSAQNSPSPKRLSKKKSFVKKIIPKFLRRSHKHSGGNQAQQRSFVVEDDDSNGENWDEDDDVFDSGTPTHHRETKVLRVHVSPTYLNRAGQQIGHVATSKIDDTSTNSAEITASHQHAVGDQRKRLEPQAKPKCLIPTAPVLEEVPVELTPAQGHGETQLISGQGQGETHLTSGHGHEEFQGQSIVGTIQVKLAPEDFDTGGDYANLIQRLAPDRTAEETDSNSNRIYDFPMFSDVSLIRNPDSVDSSGSLDDRVTPERTQKKHDIKPVSMGWGMVVWNEVAHDFASDRSQIEDMLLSSTMKDALKYRYSVEENGWGMVYSPDDLLLNWSINPISDIFSAFWDLSSIILVSFVFLIMGTAVSIVTVWQTVLMVINGILSVSKWASSVGQGKKRTRPYVAPIRLPSSASLQIENPFKKMYEVLLKPLGAIFFIFLVPFVLVDGLLQKAKRNRGGNPVTVSRSGPMNFFRHMTMIRLPHLPNLNWTARSGRMSAPVRMRMGSVWGSHSGGSRSCNCKCRGGRGKCTIS
ncbi:uncharacterized protein LOC135496931 [Lineus longissimus]|uniref:uncharacterized protein LOC135496931 n=1 Tax=Lineus longissimus TaxID=88925 RepID=UPI002B4E77B1